MARLPPYSKLRKQRKSRLLIQVRKAESYHMIRPCSFHSESCSNKIHLTFNKHIHKRYVDSSNSSLLAQFSKCTDNITICCQDPRDFFKQENIYSDTHSYISQQILESLNIKKDLHHKVIAQVMCCGRKMIKKKDFIGLIVILTTVETFVGDQDSIHRAMEECDPAKAELNDDDYLLVTSERAVD